MHKILKIPEPGRENQLLIIISSKNGYKSAPIITNLAVRKLIQVGKLTPK